ncbi:GNAT family N-acetyltransferase [Streptomyces hundungensis]|uniref:GNAT family N-acetyltransferase n=1 Tax=Streptomyces hundungensis TaxID=1077946 RepID=UPI00340EA559
MRSDQRRLISRRDNPFFETGDAHLFLARRGREVVGRIAAVDNPAYDAHHGGRQGFFGLFDCIDDVEVARALFSAAAKWLRERGHSRLLGPVNFTTNEECGILVEGFDQPPAVLMPYTPPYYPNLLEACGLASAVELLAWEIGVDNLAEAPRAQRLARYAARIEGLRVRSVDFRDFDAETARLRTLYNTAWKDNWGFCPATEREFAATAQLMRRVARPELLLIAEVHGVPAGFSLVLPDIAPALRAAGGRMHTWGLPIGLVKYWRAARRVGRTRVVATGVLPEYRSRGLDTLLHRELAKAARKLGCSTAEVSWVLAGNEPANRAVAMLGGRVSKRYALYERNL